MALYTFTCDQGHDPVPFQVEADSEDQALEALIPAVREHLASEHQQTEMSDDELRATIRDGWQKTG